MVTWDLQRILQNEAEPEEKGSLEIREDGSPQSVFEIWTEDGCPLKI